MYFQNVLKREDALAAREKFTSNEGDHISVLNVFKAYRSAHENKVNNHFKMFVYL